MSFGCAHELRVSRLSSVDPLFLGGKFGSELHVASILLASSFRGPTCAKASQGTAVGPADAEALELLNELHHLRCDLNGCLGLFDAFDFCIFHLFDQLREKGRIKRGNKSEEPLLAGLAVRVSG